MKTNRLSPVFPSKDVKQSISKALLQFSQSYPPLLYFPLIHISSIDSTPNLGVNISLLFLSLNTTPPRTNPQTIPNGGSPPLFILLPPLQYFLLRLKLKTINYQFFAINSSRQLIRFNPNLSSILAILVSYVCLIPTSSCVKCLDYFWSNLQTNIFT